MVNQILNKNWKMRCAEDPQAQWSAAVVPGSVYTDLLRNGQMEDPFFKDNEDKALKLMDQEYEYQSCFDVDEAVLAATHKILHFDGVDTLATIMLNGIVLGETENMHRVWEYEVSSLLKEKNNDLHIVFHSPTKYIAQAYEVSKTHGTEDCMDGFVNLRKAHCMFGWDWGAHLPDMGLYRPVRLLGVDDVRIDSVYVTQTHENGKVMLDFDVTLDTIAQADEKEGNEHSLCVQKTDPAAAGRHFTVTILDPDGKLVCKGVDETHFVIEQPRLWWPNGYGEQALYTVTIELSCDTDAGEKTSVKSDTDVWTRRIGLRTMTMDTHKDEWGNQFACQVNGVNIFAMGADYIPEDHLLGRVTPDTTRTLLTKGKWANFNSIRVWGGGYYPEDWFYDICDELGLVVWQDFMFACAMYDLTPAFEANIRQEFIDNVKRLRHHASLGLWCGNNEMEEFVSKRNQWITKPVEIRDYFLMYERIIPEILKEYDPNTFYWPSSPSSGGSLDDPQDPNRGDQHFWEVWHGNKPFTEYRKHYFRYLSEFGFQSFPTMKTIEKISDDPADYNIFSYIMEKHQRNGAANGKIMNYMQATYKYPSDFETVLYASQLLQADGIRYGVEHLRRNRGRCMGAIYWQFNDCWPVASWSSVDYCGRLKALHYYAKRFFAPIMLSCEEQGLMSSEKVLNWQHFEFEKSIRLNVANETREDANVTVRWALRDAEAHVLTSGEDIVNVPALTSVWLEKKEFPDVDIYTQYISYEMEKDGEIISSGTVNFSYPKYFKYKDPHLKVTVCGDEIEVCADAYAKSIEIQNENEDLVLSDNYFDLNGGSRKIRIESGDVSKLKVRSVYDIR